MSVDPSPAPPGPTKRARRRRARPNAPGAAGPVQTRPAPPGRSTLPLWRSAMPSDVVIAGAGPNGLMLACELALAGVRPLVLERLSAPSDDPKANGMVGQVIRLLDMRGM